MEFQTDCCVTQKKNNTVNRKQNKQTMNNTAFPTVFFYCNELRWPSCWRHRHFALNTQGQYAFRVIRFSTFKKEMIVGFVSFFIHLKWLSESERKAHTNEESKLQSAWILSRKDQGYDAS